MNKNMKKLNIVAVLFFAIFSLATPAYAQYYPYGMNYYGTMNNYGGAYTYGVNGIDYCSQNQYRQSSSGSYNYYDQQYNCYNLGDVNGYYDVYGTYHPSPSYPQNYAYANYNNALSYVNPYNPQNYAYNNLYNYPYTYTTASTVAAAPVSPQIIYVNVPGTTSSGTTAAASAPTYVQNPIYVPTPSYAPTNAALYQANPANNQANYPQSNLAASATGAGYAFPLNLFELTILAIVILLFVILFKRTQVNQSLI
jgi:hypothetical protein